MFKNTNYYLNNIILLSVAQKNICFLEYIH